jgi:long-chain-fatty-acid--CoA ligase ACSBG
MSETKTSKQYVLQASDVMPITIGSDPETSGLKPETIWDVLKQTCVSNGDKCAYRACQQLADTPEKKYGDDKRYFTSSSEQEYTWQNFYDRSFLFARSLVAKGFQPFSSVNMIGFNSPEWVIADVGCMMAQGLAAGIYATNNAEACQYVSKHSKAEFILVEGAAQLDKFINILKDNIEGGLPDLKSLIVYNMSPEDVDKHKNGFFKDHTIDIFEFNEFLAFGQADASTEAVVNQRMADAKPGNCAMLIYTSGTTGNPKAVMISHDNAVWTGKMLSKHIDGLFSTDRVISYLPLSHIAAQILDVISPILVGCTVTFARPDALKGTITMTLAAVKPTIFFGVPRVWEKIMAKIKAKGKDSKGLKKSLVGWAKGVAAAYSDARQGFNSAGEPNFKTASSPCGYSCADCLVLSKVKGVLGLTDARVMITGAAPISKECLDFFAALDLPIMEVYGQSECTGPATCTSPSVGWKTGTVGPVLPGTTMRIGNDKEIQYTGRHIFMGYMGMQKKTEDTLTDDGWLASGDQGAFDDDQFLSIVGRIKELIIGAGGENIAPVVVEKVLKKHMDFLSNCVVFGDNKPYLGMLVSLEVNPDPETNMPTDTLTPASKSWAASLGSDATTYSAAKVCEKVNAAVEAGRKKAIAAKEKGMVSSAAQPKFHIWLPEELTPMGENPTLTSTLKLKRNVVIAMYQDAIEKGYADQTAKFAKKK